MDKIFENFRKLKPSAGALVKSGRRTVFVVNVIVAFTLFIIVNMIFKQVTLRYDLTANKQYSLSDETMKVLSAINEDIEVAAYVGDSAIDYSRAQIERLLREYTLRQPKLKVTYVDVSRNPVVARAEGVQKTGTVIFRKGNAREVANVATETEFTSAIFKVLNPKQYEVLAWTGSGQKSLESSDVERGMSAIGEFLKSNNFTVINKNEFNDPVIPETTDVLLIAGIESPIPQQAQDELLKYVERGGKIFLLVDPIRPGYQYGIENVLARFGVSLKSGVVMEPNASLGGQPALFAITEYPSSQITESIRQTRYLIAGALEQLSPAPEGITFTPIVKTSAQSWLSSNLEMTGSRFRGSQDESGPLTIAATSQLKIDDQKQARLVVFADSDFPVNLFLLPRQELYNRDNIDIFISSMNWLVARENLYNIAPKEQSQAKVSMTDQQKQWVTLGILVGLPVLAIVVGVLVVRKRKAGK
jgi:ABC-type uncharacterized transport system involved in gliding motility auxiliary subunit